MSYIENQFIESLPIFLDIVPSPVSVFKPKIIKSVWSLLKIGRSIYNISISSIPFEEKIGNVIGGAILSNTIKKTTSSAFVKGVHIARMQRTWKNGFGGRNWISEEIDMNDGRIIKKMTINYHDADRAGRHIDLHIGRFSLIIRISGKPVESEIKFNSKGELTESAKNALIDHIRNEVKNNSRVVQNLDHSKSNAKCGWLAGEQGLKGYGKGLTRQVIIEDDVEILKTGNKNMTIYAPVLNKHNLLYIHELYPGDEKKSPIVIFGEKKNENPKFNEKLHLKMIHDLEDFKKKVDPESVTIKKDGAAAHFKTSEKHINLWSPRISKETGERIEYSGKVPEIFRISGLNAEGIGELTFKRKFNIFNPLQKSEMTAAEIGGVLNSDKIRPRNIVPEYWIYRVDKLNGKNILDIDFFQNRAVQSALAKKIKFAKVVPFVKVKERKDIEGFVGVPKGGTISDGIKFKFQGDSQDWVVTSNELKFGPTGRTAGVIWFKSIESGKEFKLGPGQLGTEEFVKSLMSDGEKIVGQVAKVISRNGHEGRAAIFEGWHMDKGQT